MADETPTPQRQRGRRDSDRQLAETLRLQSAALHAAGEAIMITDRDGRIDWVNPAFTTLTGYGMEEVFGRKAGLLLGSGCHPPEFFKELWDTILDGHAWHGEIINRRRDGTLYTENQVITPIRGTDGEITHFVAVKSDITERLRLEAELRKVQRLETIGQFASGIAHDFNNLLAVIIGVSQELLAVLPAEHPIRADITEIHDAGDQAAVLTRHLLTFSRRQVVQPRVLNLNTSILAAESQLRQLLGTDIAFTVSPTPALANVSVDPAQVDQLLANLVANARDAMPHGGKLVISTANFEIPDWIPVARGGVAAPGRYVQLTVSDTGVGMDAATQDHIFEPFFTTKPVGVGTGLGLATVFGIAKQNGGFITFESEPGVGTTFRVHLPAVAGEVAPSPRPAQAATARATETILVVEDNPAVRKLAVRMLSPVGYTVLQADSGEEALALLAEKETPIDLLLTDLMMPGLGGRALAEQVRLTQPGLGVLFMSGYTSDDAVRRGVLEPGLAFIDKPFTVAALLAKVREVLNATSARRR
ncbi:MAG: ATP-binding protein [Gemmatimonadota bacterium]